MKKKLQLLWPKIAFLIPISIFSFLLLILIGYHLAYWQKIYPGVTVLGQSVGNQDLKTASETIGQFINHASPSATLTIKSANQVCQLELADFHYQTIPTVKKAWQVGRSSNPIKNLQEKIKAWTRGIDLLLEYSLNQKTLNHQIDQIANQVFVPMIEPAIKINNQKQIEIEPGKDGLELNKKELITIITSCLSSLNFRPIELPLIKISPRLTEKQINQTKIRAEKFLGKKLVLTTDEMSWELNDEQLVQLLSFTNGYYQEKIASWSGELALAIDRPPQNAAFEFDQGRVTQFRAAKDGKNLEQKETIDLIAQSLADFEAGKKEITAQLPTTSLPPQVAMADVNRLGIQQLVGQGISYFRGSISSRIHNIQLASSKLNGLLIPPGQIFSFNQSLGEVSPSTGFK